MGHRLSSTAVALAVAAAAAAQDQGNQDNDNAAFARQRDAIRPTAEELGWQAVGWQTQLRAAVAAANREQKPVLLWAMNGHPCGQT
jgi:hypothetical protein